MKKPRKSYNRLRAREEAALGVQDLMSKLGLSKTDLAKRMGRSKSFVSKVLSGDHNFTIDTLADVYFSLGKAVHFGFDANFQSIQMHKDFEMVSSSCKPVGAALTELDPNASEDFADAELVRRTFKDHDSQVLAQKRSISAQVYPRLVEENHSNNWAA